MNILNTLIMVEGWASNVDFLCMWGLPVIVQLVFAAAAATSFSIATNYN